MIVDYNLFIYFHSNYKCNLNVFVSEVSFQTVLLKSSANTYKH